MLRLTKEEKAKLKESISTIEKIVKGKAAVPEAELEDLNKLLEIVDVFQREMSNLQSISELFVAPPGEVPTLSGVDIYGKVIPLYGIGGDHITYLDFKKRFSIDERIRIASEELKYDPRKAQVIEKLELNKSRAGVLIADAEGHMNTDSFISKLLHQCFMLAAHYELLDYGEITHRILRNINMRFFESTSVQKTITALYCEVHETGKVKFISAGHPLPVVFSNEWNKFVRVKSTNGHDFEVSSPLGMQPSANHPESSKYAAHPLGFKKPYVTNELDLLGRGDIMLLYTDGLADHRNSSEVEYMPRLEERLAKWKQYPAHKITDLISIDLMEFNPVRKDDVSFVVIKRA